MKSMTGFGRIECSRPKIQIELKTLNHRFFEFKFRAPQEYSLLEVRFLKLLKQFFARGFVELSLFKGKNSKQKTVKLDQKLLKNVVSELRHVQKKIGLEGRIHVSDILNLSSLWKIPQELSDSNRDWKLLKKAVIQCAQKVLKMRQKEGEALQKDLTGHLSLLETETKAFLLKSKDATLQYKKRLKARLKEMIKEKALDPVRLHEEVGYLMSRSDISEELVRLQSHFKQFREILKSPASVGKKLDFLTQEMHREINTIGSKIQDSKLTQKIIQCKNLLEKIKEQVQNVE